MLRIPAVVAACVAVLLAASACTDDKPDPNFSSVSTSATPTPSSSTSPSATPNTTANVPAGSTQPTRPAPARTSDGAFAFAAYYWRMVDWAYSTNDGDVLSGLYQGTCASCASFSSSINESAKQGYTLIGGHIAVSSLSLSTTDDVATAEFGIDVSLAVDELDSRTTDGAVATTYPSAMPTYRMYLGWVQDGWQIVETATVTGQ